MGNLKRKIMGERVLHIPNIQDEAGIRGLESIEKYKLRMLSPLYFEDSAIMPADTKRDTEELFKLYDQLVISHPKLENILFLDYDHQFTLSKAIFSYQNEVRKQLKNLAFTHIEPFIFSGDMDKVAFALDQRLKTDAEASEVINNKYLCQTALREIGVSVPKGKLVHSQKEAEGFAKELIEDGYKRVSFKLTRAASGLGVFCISPEEIPEYCKKYAEEMSEHGILIDGWIDKEKLASPNIQYFVGEKEEDDVFISSTDQILEGTVHKGNIYKDLFCEMPKLRADMEKVRNWVRSQKYQGIIGVDWLIDTDKQHYFMEINGRINGSTPGAMIMDKLFGTTTKVPWGVQNNVYVGENKSTSDFIGQLEKENLLYQPDTMTGVLPTNTSAISSHNKAMVLIIGDTQKEVEEILHRLYELNQHT